MKMTNVKQTVIKWVSLGCLAFASAVSAAVEVKLVEPDKFHDADVSGMSKARSYETVRKDLTRLFEEVTQDQIQEQQTLVVEVTDVDLAGYINYFVGSSNRDIRMVRDNDRYRLEFKYTLKDANGNVVSQGEKEIKQFLNRTASELRRASSSRYQTVAYMYKEVDDWVKTELTSP